MCIISYGRFLGWEKKQSSWVGHVVLCSQCYSIESSDQHVGFWYKEISWYQLLSWQCKEKCSFCYGIWWCISFRREITRYICETQICLNNTGETSSARTGLYKGSPMTPLLPIWFSCGIISTWLSFTIIGKFKRFCGIVFLKVLLTS